MTTLFLTIALFALIMLAMAVGVIVSGRRLRGSCGGSSSCHCRADGLDPSLCDREALTGDSPAS